MTHLDLFTGIGGFTIAFKQAGFETIAFSETEPFCVNLLKQHWPKIPNLGDIRFADPVNLPPIDVITAGFPCQPHSFNGNRKGKNDHRWLWPHLVTLLGKVRSKIILLENVPGVLSNETFGDILKDLASLRYDAEWNCLPAYPFGSPQRRTRLWLVAYTNSERWQWSASKQTVWEEGKQSSSFWDDIERCCSRMVGTFPPGRRDLCSWSRISTEFQPCILGMVNGIPYKLDRFRGLGNAVVPQVARAFAEAISTQLRLGEIV